MNDDLGRFRNFQNFRFQKILLKTIFSESSVTKEIFQHKQEVIDASAFGCVLYMGLERRHDQRLPAALARRVNCGAADLSR
jgi:hypothetical protein